MCVVCSFFPGPMERWFSLLFLQWLGDWKPTPSEIYLIHLVLKDLFLGKKKNPYLLCKPLRRIFALIFFEACPSPRIKFIELETKMQSMTRKTKSRNYRQKSLPIRMLSGKDPISVPPIRRVCS